MKVLLINNDKGWGGGQEHLKVLAGELARRGCSPHLLCRRGSPSEREFALLGFFIRHANQVVTRQQILDQVWGDHVYIEERTVDVDAHARNFFDCIKSRQKPFCEVEEGKRVNTACHLANSSLRLGRKIRWDPVKEVIIGDASASKLLTRDMRSPWRL